MIGPGYRIGALAKLAGLSTHSIRVWERRYGAAAPSRTSGGARLYSEADVQRYKLIKQLLEQGYATRAIANLDVTQLSALAAPEAASAAEPSETDPSERAREVIEAMLDAVRDMNVEAAERAFSRASNQYTPRDLISSVLGPALEAIGARWASGELGPASEHAASALLRTRLGALLSAQSVGKTAPIICTTPSGELHELGALLVAVLIAMRGRRAIFLGANLPASQIAEAVRLSKADSVALSLVGLPPRDAQRELARICKLLPAHVHVLVGGRGSKALQRVPARVRVLSTLIELEDWLDSRQL